MAGKSTLDRMKTKNFSIILVLVILSSASLWLLSYPSSPSISNIVSKTQTSIKSIPHKLKNKDEGQTVDPRYLARLGLAPPPVNSSVSPDVRPPAGPLQIPTPKTTTGRPVIASGARTDRLDEADMLMRSVQNYLPDHKLVMYDLDLSSSEKVMLKKYCNSTWGCEVRKLMYEKFPSHLQYLDIRSYRPVCIQEMLNKHGAVVWVDEGFYFTHGNLSITIGRAKESGIIGWPIKQPTSSFTHQKMFQYFKEKQDHFYFQRPIEPSHLILFNTERLARHIMLPWVKCALLEDCISPPGAQNSGCHPRRPYFLYSGCHRYDMSALNILLGRAFQMETENYTANEDLFGNLRVDRLRAQNKTLPQFEVNVGRGGGQ